MEEPQGTSDLLDSVGCVLFTTATSLFPPGQNNRWSLKSGIREAQVRVIALTMGHIVLCSSHTWPTLKTFQNLGGAGVFLSLNMTSHQEA